MFFPNLQLDVMFVDFGCILNDTEVTRCIHMTNTGPIPVSYQWSFVLSDQQPVTTFYHQQPVNVGKSSVIVEDLDNTETNMNTTHRPAGDVVNDAVDDDDDAIQVDISVKGCTESPQHVGPDVTGGQAPTECNCFSHP